MVELSTLLAASMGDLAMTVPCHCGCIFDMRCACGEPLELYKGLDLRPEEYEWSCSCGAPVMNDLDAHADVLTRRVYADIEKALGGFSTKPTHVWSGYIDKLVIHGTVSV